MNGIDQNPFVPTFFCKQDGKCVQRRFGRGIRKRFKIPKVHSGIPCKESEPSDIETLTMTGQSDFLKSGSIFCVVSITPKKLSLNVFATISLETFDAGLGSEIYAALLIKISK